MDESASSVSLDFGLISDSAIAKLDKLSSSIKSIADMPAMKKLNLIKSSISSFNKQLDSGTRSIQKLSSQIRILKGPSVLGGVSDTMKQMSNKIKSLAIYLTARTAIKYVTDALKQGAERAYFYAKEFGNATKYIADALDQLSSKNFKMQNQLGAAWATLLATIQPILLQIIGVVTRAAEVVTQFFAIMSGSGTYLKAKDYTKAWADETEKGAAAAKEWKNQLLGFDEINRLEAPSDTNRGSGNNDYTDYEKHVRRSEG